MVVVNKLGLDRLQRLFEACAQQSIADRLFEIEFLGRGVEAFSFTFG